MAEYIERNALLKDIAKIGGCPWSEWETAGVCDVVTKQPAADVAPMRHGRWVDKPTGRYGQMQSWCTACGKNSGIGGIKNHRHKPYCPNCGAKMDLEAQHD